VKVLFLYSKDIAYRDYNVSMVSKSDECQSMSSLG